MKRPREIPFGKFHALGNDWIVVAGRDLSWCRSDGALARVARRVLDRHAGIGADGLITLLPPRNKAHDARVRFFNADGSEAEMSGNGIRCAAAFLEARGARLEPLPPYSPDLNPIEQCWAKLKTALRQARARTREALEAALKQALQTITPADAQAWFTHCGYPVHS
jgi:hypothetical protein